ncbi:hypothetical protein [Zunongwangia pacifica]|uniref:Uncharacterized protein n=1 Tax=Zunongwangia pacifica TaxID=2911062 RepID=A0A9X1ZSB8_9FLAO|nr:hypothetical protein [Zunongwangia pacifica]MCL6220147.1 hypothetical protein [Zunongwangia pacifica]
MRLSDSKYVDQVIEIIDYDFGIFYFLEDIVVSEIHEGITFDWECAEKVIIDAKRILGEDCRPHYISNRINKYYTVSQDWLKFFNNLYFLKSFSVITPHPSGMMNLIFERMFYRRKIYQVSSLHEAFQRIRELQEEKIS